ncbi:MAG: type II toxin-antitoxin system VapB family antitoxin [Pseudomonadota bacterium]
MPQPQLSVRSQKARDLAHELAAREKRSIAEIVEEALEAYSARRATIAGRRREDALADLKRIIAEGRAKMTGDPGRGSDLSDFYDEDGLPI